jgi:hypothetical protein
VPVLPDQVIDRVLEKQYKKLIKIVFDKRLTNPLKAGSEFLAGVDQIQQAFKRRQEKKQAVPDEKIMVPNPKIKEIILQDSYHPAQRPLPVFISGTTTKQLTHEFAKEESVTSSQDKKQNLKLLDQNAAVSKFPEFTEDEAALLRSMVFMPGNVTSNVMGNECNLFSAHSSENKVNQDEPIQQVQTRKNISDSQIMQDYVLHKKVKKN